MAAVDLRDTADCDAPTRLPTISWAGWPTVEEVTRGTVLVHVSGGQLTEGVIPTGCHRPPTSPGARSPFPWSATRPSAGRSRTHSWTSRRWRQATVRVASTGTAITGIWYDTH